MAERSTGASVHLNMAALCAPRLVLTQAGASREHLSNCSVWLSTRTHGTRVRLCGARARILPGRLLRPRPPSLVARECLAKLRRERRALPLTNASIAKSELALERLIAGWHWDLRRSHERQAPIPADGRLGFRIPRGCHIAAAAIAAAAMSDGTGGSKISPR
jgi:hypothetical protein